MISPIGLRRWSALLTAPALIVAAGLTGCSNSPAGPSSVARDVCPEVTVTSSSGEVTVLDQPLDDVRKEESPSDVAQAFAESQGDDHGGFTLDVDASNNTNIENGGSPVEAGVPVCSYYVHYDDGGTSFDERIITGSLTFDSEIQGLITAAGTNENDIFNQAGINTLCDTDDNLGNDGTAYPDPGNCGIKGDARGMEFFDPDPTRESNPDVIEITGDRKTVEFTSTIVNRHDSFRVIFDLSE